MSVWLFLNLALIFPYVLGQIIPPAHQNARELFEKFKQKYKKAYSNAIEENKRFSIFMDNLARSEVLQKYEKDTATYGVTKFSDLTAEEFAAQFLNARFDNLTKELKVAEPMKLKSERALPSFDWRDKGAVTAVKDQGFCGSCWAFSVVGNIEGQYYLSGGNLTELSVQELLDCDQVDEGCVEGNPLNAYPEIQRLGGLVSNADYPYRARSGPCRLNASQIVTNISNAYLISKNEAHQAVILHHHGPLSTALDATQLQLYTSGVFNPRRCSKYGLNHAVLTVGYGEERGIPFWTVKNSWGVDWGEEGYFRIRRGRGTCGINTLVTTAEI